MFRFFVLAFIILAQTAHDERMLWPDTLSVASNGYLYFTANQLHRQKNFQGEKDMGEKPYAVLRIKIDAGPLLLNRNESLPKQVNEFVQWERNR